LAVCEGDAVWVEGGREGGKNACILLNWRKIARRKQEVCSISKSDMEREKRETRRQPTENRREEKTSAQKVETEV